MSPPKTPLAQRVPILLILGAAILLYGLVLVGEGIAYVFWGGSGMAGYSDSIMAILILKGLLFCGVGICVYLSENTSLTAICLAAASVLLAVPVGLFAINFPATGFAGLLRGSDTSVLASIIPATLLVLMLVAVYKLWQFSHLHALESGVPRQRLVARRLPSVLVFSLVLIAFGIYQLRYTLFYPDYFVQGLTQQPGTAIGGLFPGILLVIAGVYYLLGRNTKLMAEVSVVVIILGSILVVYGASKLHENPYTDPTTEVVSWAVTGLLLACLWALRRRIKALP